MAWLISWTLTLGMTVGPVCGTAVKYYLENASSECPGGHYLEHWVSRDALQGVNFPTLWHWGSSPNLRKCTKFNTLKEGGSAGNNHILLYTQQGAASRRREAEKYQLHMPQRK